jgi:transketolase
MDVPKQDLHRLAKNIRIESLKLCNCNKSTHIGSALSCADILAVLYGEVLKDKDRFVLSKGHSASATWTALALTGGIPMEKLQDCSPDVFPDGIAFSSGSLGHGLSIACGMALADREHKVYVLVGDGEMNEGSNWEAIMFAVAMNLSNLVLIIDNNHLQAYGRDVLNKTDFTNKFLAFGWNVFQVNGNDIDDLVEVFEATSLDIELPSVVIAETTKGYGVSYMEDDLEWHYLLPDDEQLASAIEEVNNG